MIGTTGGTTLATQTQASARITLNLFEQLIGDEPGSPDQGGVGPGRRAEGENEPDHRALRQIFRRVTRAASE